MAKNLKATRRLRRKRSIRKKVSGTASRPRLSVFRSNMHITAQLIDDASGRTLAAATSQEEGVTGSKSERGAEVGKRLASRASEQGIETVVFDRNGYPYHGRVKALADGAREGGLKF